MVLIMLVKICNSNWSQMDIFGTRWLKLAQNTLITLYFYLQVTGSWLIKYFVSSVYLMMLDMLSRICLTPKQSAYVPFVWNMLYAVRGNKTRRIRICNNIFPFSWEKKSFSGKTEFHNFQRVETQQKTKFLQHILLYFCKTR